jgi:DNA-binding NarL/FixJ family response regulator
VSDQATLDVRLLRVAVLHPQRAWAEALECMLDGWPSIEVVIAHTSYDWVAGAAARGDIDVVVAALGDPGFGPTHLAELQVDRPELRAVVISGVTDAELIAAAVRAGARGWLRPTASAQELVRAVIDVGNGRTWLPPDVAGLVIESLLASEKARAVSQSAIAKLSTRELEILGCLAAGMTRPQICEHFQLSPHTVRTHINHVLRKLEVHSTLAAVSLVNKARVP